MNVKIIFNIYQKKFAVWEPGKNFLVKVIYFINDIFYDENYFVDKESFNPEIANLFHDNPEEFEKEVFSSAMKSVSEKYNVVNKNSSLKFSEFNKYHQLILDKILKQNKEVNTFDRIEDFKNWFMNNFMEIIQSSEMKNSQNLQQVQK